MKRYDKMDREIVSQFKGNSTLASYKRFHAYQKNIYNLFKHSKLGFKKNLTVSIQY